MDKNLDRTQLPGLVSDDVKIKENGRKDSGSTITINMKSHNGIRGLCALWVVLFHNFLLGSYGDKIRLNGSVAITIFFILSGFALSAIHGKSDENSINKTNLLVYYSNIVQIGSN